MKCPACTGRLQVIERGLFDTRFGLADSYDIARCDECRLEVTVPVGGPANLTELYEEHYNFGGERDTLYTKVRGAALSAAAYRMWLRLDGDISFFLRRGGGRLLDVGCNEGRTLEHYRRNGWRAEGLELNSHAARVARARGFVVHTVPLAELALDSQFDVIVLSNVLEHVPDVNGFLDDCHRLLKRGGQLWVSLPNSASWLRSVFGKHWINWHVPFHLVHFSPASLVRLLRARSFEIVDAKQATPALWVAQSAIARLFARRGKRTARLRDPVLIAASLPLIRFALTPVIAVANRLGHGDCLVVTART